MVANTRQITIRNVDPETLKLLELEAQRRGIDLNDVANEALSRGTHPAATESPSQAQVEALAGTWTHAEADEFMRAMAPLSEVDPDLWK
jgi:hypothetical protein